MQSSLWQTEKNFHVGNTNRVTKLAPRNFDDRVLLHTFYHPLPFQATIEPTNLKT